MSNCFDCFKAPAQVEEYARVVQQAKKYVKEKKVSVAVLRSPTGFEISESLTGPILEVFLHDPHTATEPVY